MKRVYTDASKTAICIASTDSPSVRYISGLTVNQGEYLAIIAALILSHPTEELEICSDSELAIKQLNGEYVCRDLALQVLCGVVLAFTTGREVKFTWVRREDNKAGLILG